MGTLERGGPAFSRNSHRTASGSPSTTVTSLRSDISAVIPLRTSGSSLATKTRTAMPKRIAPGSTADESPIPVAIGERAVAVLVRRSETKRPSKCLEDTRGELARKGLAHRRMSNDSSKKKWSCQSVDEQVGVGIRRQLSGGDGLLDQV